MSQSILYKKIKNRNCNFWLKFTIFPKDEQIQFFNVMKNIIYVKGFMKIYRLNIKNAMNI